MNPEPLPTTPVLYSFRRCPYAMRARLALVASGETIEWREIVLRAKPEHMLALSPKGTVPVLWLPDGTVIDESLDVMFWALQRNDPFGWLDLSGPQADQAKAMVEQLDGDFKYHLDRYKYASRYDNCDPIEHQQACISILVQWANQLANHSFLLGANAKYVDYALLPFVRQFRIANPACFDAHADIEPVKRWLQAYFDSALFKAIMPKRDPWRPGDSPVYLPGLSLGDSEGL